MAIANALALERAGIGESSPDPDGGEYLRRTDGTLTGVLIENADNAVLDAYTDDFAARGPEAVKARLEMEIDLAVSECLSNGVTSFHDAGSTFEWIDVYRSLADEGRLGVRLYVMVSAEDGTLGDQLDEYRTIGYGNDHLTVRAIKEYIDGALGAHGAWMLAPYEDLPESTGHNTRPLQTLDAAARAAIEHDYQFCVHAIGDRGNREILDLYERHYATRPGADLRWRIEHAQHLDPADIPRFAESRRDRRDAGRALHIGRPLGARPHRRRAREGGRLRLALVARLGRRDLQRHRCPGRGRQSDRELPRLGDPRDRRGHRRSFPSSA